MLVESSVPASSASSSLLFSEVAASSSLLLDLHSSDIAALPSTSSVTLDDEFFAECLPPNYSPSSAEPPVYTSLAAHDERVLLGRPRRVRQSREFTHLGETHAFSSRLGTVELLDQPADARPTYGREALVHGRVILDSAAVDLKKVQAVSLTLEGRVSASFSGQVDNNLLFLELSQTLVTDNSNIYEFSLPLPSSVPSDVENPLPPSFANDCASARVEYNLIVRVATKGLWGKGLSVTVPFDYRPETIRRSPQPPLPATATLLNTIKEAPDEWASTSFRVQSSSIRSQGLDVEAAFPASRAFAPGERVPMHIQVTGHADSVSALRPIHNKHLLSPQWSSAAALTALSPQTSPAFSIRSLPLSRSSSRTDSPVPSPRLSTRSPLSSTDTLVSQRAVNALLSSPAGSAKAPLSFQVALERRTVTTDRAGRKHLSTQVLSLCPLLPSLEADSDCGDHIVALDGVLVIPESSAANSWNFRIGPVVVSDALVIAALPAPHAPYRKSERAVSVRLVSEAWEEQEAELAGFH
ncbi:hypothetical protein BKA62DRAFT_757075 [Auriculariales sp. MPI-PUGE-AT-0066]|nr:hypothetical protein BKA62DRAFT_757075 [Auriculariales sp. MPI-PUGE-AT-0066]